MTGTEFPRGGAPKQRKLGKYKIQLPKMKAFAVESPPDELALHQLNVLVAARGGGKTLAVINKMRHLQNQNLCDRVFMITPTKISNAPILSMIKISDDDIYEKPEAESLVAILEKLDEEKAEWNDYLEKVKKYERLKKFMLRKDKSLIDVSKYWDVLGGSQDILEKPKPKYSAHRPPICHVIIDDCVGSPLFNVSTKSPLVNFLLRHHHVAEGMGCSVWLCAQCYIAAQGGLPRSLRENVTSICLFKTKDKKTITKMCDELANTIEPEIFMKAYEAATKEKYSFLLVDFSCKTPDHQFRIGWDTLLLFDENKNVV